MNDALIHKVNLINGFVNYIDPLSDEGLSVKKAELEIPKENEKQDLNTFEQNKAEIPLVSELSLRNYKNTYIVPMELPRVLLNLIPEKIFITDTNIIMNIDTTFNYFSDDESESGEPEPYELIDGIIFRWVENGPKPIQEYTYYIMDDGIVKQIPNFKTLEVMLFQRNENYLSVRVLEKSQFNDIIENSPSESMDDMSTQWKAEMEDQVNMGKYLELLKTAKDAGAVAAAATAEADKNINAYKAERDAEKAKADQAKAEAEASKKQAEAEIEKAKQKQAEAEQAEAKAKQAEAEARQKEAEADAKKAEFEAQT